jgi:hypothetical protein
MTDALRAGEPKAALRPAIGSTDPRRAGARLRRSPRPSPRPNDSGA